MGHLSLANRFLGIPTQTVTIVTEVTSVTRDARTGADL